MRGPQNVILDQFSFVSVLRSCIRLSESRTGLAVHSVVLRYGFDLFRDLRNTLLNFYCVCVGMSCARQVFDEFPKRDLVSWNTLMGGHLCARNCFGVLDMFVELRRDGICATVTTMLSVLSAIGELKVVLVGESMHCYCIKIGFCYSLKVLTALISMYGKIGYISLGRTLFDEAYPKDVVLWNCLIDGYAKNGLLEEALFLLREMKVQSLKPNSSTLAGLLSFCASSGALNMGEYIQDFVEDQKLALDPVHGTVLIDMYAKCGLLVKAVNVFDNMETKDVKCWTAMIMGYGVHGKAKDAIALFHRMEDEGFRPNEVTFLAVFSACSHGGLVAEGISYFRRMVLEYGLTPKIEHYGCLIDILGRAGLLETARELIKGLPIEGDASAWRTLLAACRVHGSVELGEQVKKELEQRFGEHPADSLLLNGTYAIAGILPEEGDTLEVKEGPNGAGKTTFINMIAKTENSTPVTDNFLLTDDWAHKTNLWDCICSGLLWEKLSGREHILFYGMLKNLKGAVLTQAVDESLESVNLFQGGVADKQSGKYSGEMKRRLSVAFSLIGDPKQGQSYMCFSPFDGKLYYFYMVVYMDEPSTELDTASRNNLWNVVKRAKTGLSSVLRLDLGPSQSQRSHRELDKHLDVNSQALARHFYPNT
ncbi:Pentatricopeptide repeat-containing protein, mitochondrial [Capsicum annuum]|uniref:Pentatricopeptide repeat-containing protein, mitochondrial n=1 Tax=Capsicum annuum TaxID=4072 RepID=A0A2G3A1G7_CAPAN|nr:Pentatricopeptide repeat-containing protein, mitochondrial [Capsicum annuum]